MTQNGQSEYLRFSALSSPGYEPDGHRKQNQDAFISFIDFGLIPIPFIFILARLLEQKPRFHFPKRCFCDCIDLERSIGVPTVSVFGVFDGHGSQGHNVSAFVRRCVLSAPCALVPIFCHVFKPPTTQIEWALVQGDTSLVGQRATQGGVAISQAKRRSGTAHLQ